MEKKIALALATLLALTVVVSTPLYVKDSTVEAVYPPWHWKIMLAQQGCNAWIVGWLTLNGQPIPGTDFMLRCNCTLPEPQPLGQFVFTKIPTNVIPNDIHYVKYIDWNKDGYAEERIPIDAPIPGPIWPSEDPNTWYQHEERGAGPFGPWIVVVEVRQQPYDAKDPYFYWQLTVKQHGLTTDLVGYLTLNGQPISGTDYTIHCGKTLMCQVKPTPWCTVPNDIHLEVLINGLPPPILIDQPITQFPWTYTYTLAPGVDVTLELTEVQVHHYSVMNGWLNSGGQLDGLPPWNTTTSWRLGDGVPFATRAPYVMPLHDGQTITFTQRDPITGIVLLGVPLEGFVSLDHMWYSSDQGTWFRARILLEEQGCGWIYTGVGKQPILGSVDLKTYNNYQGVYTFGPDNTPGTADDELLAGTVGTGSAGAGPPIGPCLQLLRGPDNIPGTGDDPIGRGDTSGPNPPGSSILYLPTTMYVTFWNDAPGAKRWDPLFQSPWPQLFTTGTSSDTVIEPVSSINGQSVTRTGKPWEFFAGIEHPASKVPWKNPKCNVYVTYVACWSVLHTATPLGNVDVIFEVEETKVRDDDLIADINADEVCNIVDIVIAALAFDTQDEWIGPDGIPMTADDHTVADLKYDARGDLRPALGLVNIVDIVRIALDFDKTLDP